MFRGFLRLEYFHHIEEKMQLTLQAGDSLVYSFNDYQGYGYHGDFFNGWEDGLIDVRKTF